MGELVAAIRAGVAGESVTFAVGDALVRATPQRRRNGEVVFSVPGAFDLEIAARSVRYELRSRALWTEGYAALAARLIDACERWVSGDGCELGESRDRGWRVTRMELCRDAQGIPAWTREDSERARWVGYSARTEFTVKDTAGCVRLAIGTRRSPVSWCGYSKTRELAAKGKDPEIYAGEWRRSGVYDPTREVMRSEFRLGRRGLDLMDAATGECGILRDPAALADDALLGRVWSYLNARYRMVRPDTATRRKRCEVDPRWLAFAGGLDVGQDARRFVQDRAGARLAYGHRREQARLRALRAVAADAGAAGVRLSTGRAAAAWVEHRYSTAPAGTAEIMARACESALTRVGGLFGPEIAEAQGQAREHARRAGILGWAFPPLAATPPRAGASPPSSWSSASAPAATAAAGGM